MIIIIKTICNIITPTGATEDCLFVKPSSVILAIKVYQKI